MECGEVRELLLECAITDLYGKGYPSLRDHLQDCPDCQRIADEMIAAESALNSFLGSRGPSRSFEEVAAALVSHHRKRSPRFFRPLPLILSTAAAALLLVVVMPMFNRNVDSPIVRELPELRVELPVVKAPPDMTALIMDSGNPDYQIIWLF